MPPQRRVLIVDQLSETRETLRSVLETHGLRIFEAGGADEGLTALRDERPDIVVLDMEETAAEDHLRCEALVAATQQQQTPLVLLGSARRAPEGVAKSDVVRKPYHYGPLVRKIEQLLESSQRSAA